MEENQNTTPVETAEITFKPDAENKPDVEQSKPKKKTNLIAIIGAAVAVVALIVAGIFVVPKLLMTSEKALANGDYDKAYELAKSYDDRQAVREKCLELGIYEKAYQFAQTDEMKYDVYVENLVAVYSKNYYDILGKPGFFDLREAYFEDKINDDGSINKQLILYLSYAKDTGKPQEYFVRYAWDNDKNQLTLLDVFDNLSPEEYKKYDSYETTFNKLINNMVKESIQDIINNEYKLSTESIVRISNLLSLDEIDSVHLLNIPNQ